MRKHSATLRKDSALTDVARATFDIAALKAMIGMPLTPQARRNARAIVVSTFGGTASTCSTSSFLLRIGSTVSPLVMLPNSYIVTPKLIDASLTIEQHQTGISIPAVDVSHKYLRALG